MIVLLALAAPAPSAAQATESGLPTLEDLGLWWASPDGRYQAGFSGRLDLEGYLPDESPTGLLTDVDPFAAARMRLFLDAFVGERLYGSLELRVDHGETPRSGALAARVEQLFVRARPTAAPVELQLGRFASPFGSYAARHHTPADVFIRPPLAYDARTIICPTIAPGSAAGFLTWRDRPEEFRGKGAPIVWNVPYQWGAMALVGEGRFDARVAWMNSVVSSAPDWWALDLDGFGHGALVVGAGWLASPELRLGASWTRGPYFGPLASGTLPAGSDRWDFDQEVWGAEASFSRGPVVVRGELFHDSWEVPNVADEATDLSWYVEAQSDLMAGLWVAGRVGATHFGEIENPAGQSAQWDYDVWRTQLSAGYRVVRNAEIKIEWLRDDAAGRFDARDDLLSAQLWWSY